MALLLIVLEGLSWSLEGEVPAWLAGGMDCVVWEIAMIHACCRLH